MKIRRFFAADMRQALRQVREALGADAVILSNKSVQGGVELVAAIDYDESAFTLSQPISPQTQSQPASKTQRHATTSAASRDLNRESGRTTTAERSTSKDETKPHVEWSQDPVLREMRSEMQAMRRMMENELSELTWRDLGQRRPQTQDLMRRLIGLGLDAAHCRELAFRVGDAETPEQAWRQSLFHLNSELPIYKDDLLDRGGIVALVGPTGVGKTTTIAKLAAKFCLRHGNRQLALISTDSYRIGAQEQLHNYGRILDVPVRSAASADELSDALHVFADKRLVLIDTAGMGLRDLKLSERLSLMTSGNHPIKTLLTLSATTQRSALSHAIHSFAAAQPVAAIITKVDEAAELGGVFSGLMDAGLPLAYMADGQRVPEDIHVASAKRMVSQAVEMCDANACRPDEDYLAMAFGGMGEHAHV
ncbi:MAG: flagellar biosynthesis protein FlhF [Candidatus Thiodiazotropha sp. (ex Gloverina cf. vestifex)]|nr:flagellar biosynthesis protein FlhF [Candidatus Thiodiazotropha sp. (ex Gloverina cf. vestifex)]